MPGSPVVFVPGLGGSFNLLVLLDWRGPTLSGWDFPPFIDYGKAFLDTFSRAGYTRDRDLFVAFYDWRKSVNDNASNYLVPWIDRARRISGSQKVILVSHSMGGLVARSYIQSNGYRGDVERLITLGTPHRGAPEAYYPWGGGDVRWSPALDTVFNVYLWYLEHAHPFQSGLDRLRTIRTQAPGIRDLLPIDDYLQDQGPPLRPEPENLMRERNLWGDVLNTPDGLATLLGRTPLTTINGTGFTTVQGLTVEAPPPPVDNPPRYVDGRPVNQQTTGEGDGTVLLSSARIDDPRIRNLPPVALAHDQLPDQTAAQILAELNVAPPTAATVQPSVPRLVILTASPVELIVEAPAPPTAPAVLGAEEAPAAPRRRRGQRVRAYNLGHRGKHLNMAIIPDPPTGTYNVRLRGTATGTFALGALMIGVQSTAVLSADETTDTTQQPKITPISTVQGQVAAQTELHYQVECMSYAAPPQVRFDAEATTRDALARLAAATRAPTPAVLSAEETAAPVAHVQGVLSAAEAPAALRATASAALTGGDSGATQQLATMLRSGDPAAVRLLSQLAEHVVGARDKNLALGLLEQLKQIAALGGEGE